MCGTQSRLHVLSSRYWLFGYWLSLVSVCVIFKGNVLSNLRIHVSLADYGNVVELRINSGGKLPNFGFVVFDDSEPVQKVLSNRVSSFPS